ncbi:hypothetical protein PMIN06_011450 [Paraphaeosphaeria minitans]|uniref:SCP domain-containing protein n=1 Tax=Paraphaeosphaeria minitans TaxID=565426 RepID=A0A9P6GB62_9PLEO|nr:hypothetical protein PMIN01_10226 [Paraphaeosphaeria minitans]
MHAYATLGMLALAGSAMAAPKPRYGGYGGHGGNPHVVWETAVVTVIVGPDGQPIDAAAPTPAPEPLQGYVPAPAEPSSAVVKPPPPQSYQVPEQPSPTPSPEPSNPPSSGGGYIDIANQWRAKLGLPAYEQDDTLQNNALKTCDDGNGEMVHELNPGTFGQTLAPGQPDEFERVFVGGWLCERPDLPGLDGICNTMSQGWAYNGQTGHADIITGDYKKIGCANAKGIWGCDYA